MEMTTLPRLDGQALSQLLDTHVGDLVGTALRLAWQAGLSRGELLQLTWDDVQFFNKTLTVHGRHVPLCQELYTYLMDLEADAPPQTNLVVLGDGKRHRPPSAQALSRKVGAVLDAHGQRGLRLADLRHDYILTQLTHGDWQTVSRHTGLTLQTLQTHFAPLLPQGELPGKTPTVIAPIDPIRLQQVLHRQGDTPQGLALRLAWQLGMARQDMVTLTWGAFNLKKGFLLQNGVKIPLDEELLAFFRTLPPHSPDTLVIRGPLSGTAVLPDRLSRLCRTALVQGGLDDCTLQTLRQAHALRQGGEAQVLDVVRSRGYITVSQTATMLKLGEQQAYHRLKQWVTHGKLLQVGRRYYLPHTIVPPDQQPQVVVQYLSENGIAYRSELAKQLGISPQQCSVLLKKLVHQGTIQLRKQQYSI